MKRLVTRRRVLLTNVLTRTVLRDFFFATLGKKDRCRARRAFSAASDAGATRAVRRNGEKRFFHPQPRRAEDCLKRAGRMARAPWEPREGETEEERETRLAADDVHRRLEQARLRELEEAYWRSRATSSAPDAD